MATSLRSFASINLAVAIGPYGHPAARRPSGRLSALSYWSRKLYLVSDRNGHHVFADRNPARISLSCIFEQRRRI